MSGVTKIFCRERVGARCPTFLDIFVDGETGAVGEGGRGQEEGPPDTQPSLGGAPGPGPGRGLRLVGAQGVQGDVVAHQGAHAGEARHEVADPLVRVQRELAAREEDPDTCGALLGPLEGQGVGVPGILAVPD